MSRKKARSLPSTALRSAYSRANRKRPRLSLNFAPNAADKLVVAPSPRSVIPFFAVISRPLRLVAQLEVDDAGHGVRAISRRSAAGYDLDRPNQRLRDGVQVDRTIGAGRHQPLAVEQHQRAVRAEATKIAVGLTAGKANRALRVAHLGRALRSGELRQLANRLIQRRLAGRGQDIAADRRNGARRCGVTARNARARDNDVLFANFLERLGSDRCRAGSSNGVVCACAVVDRPANIRARNPVAIAKLDPLPSARQRSPAIPRL